MDEGIELRKQYFTPIIFRILGIILAWLFIETISSDTENEILKLRNLTGSSIGEYTIFWSEDYFLEV